MLPQAREEGLVIQEVADETLVYDLERHRAHCLNRTAALVWRRCDGTTPVASLAAQLEEEVGSHVEEGVVWLALERLEKAHLLRPGGGSRKEGACSRREVMRRLALAGGLALLLPTVKTIVAPTPAAAQSGGPCSQPGEECILQACCPGSQCVGTVCVPNEG
jgi:hypothetical protein